MKIFSSYNKIFFLYKYPQYIHYDKDDKYITLSTSSVHYNAHDSIFIQGLYEWKTNNVEYYYHHVHNTLMENTKTRKEMIYIKVQRFKLAFSRFIHIVKMKYKKKYNMDNLLFLPFKNEPIRICENGIVYLFDDNEIYKMIEGCFNYEEYERPCILSLKNPYTNVPFKFYNLIYIYFELLKRGKNSMFFTLYFKTGFSKKELTEKYNCLLLNNCLSHKFDNKPIETKDYYLYKMINHFMRYKYFKNVNRDLLRSLFNGVLKDYYLYLKLIDHGIDEDTSLVLNYKRKFSKRLRYIYNQNTSFGKKIMCRTLNNNYKCKVNETLFI